MDYVVGGVAALITGNVTPNRPRLTKRALTPTKHQPSPNVTPKSEFVEDRSIFLSPSMQKKKAIVKKSPKRIFQNPVLEVTDNGEGNLNISSPKADKVKKHLKDDLECENVVNKSTEQVTSPKKKGKNKRESVTQEESSTEVVSNENTPKKKKKKRNNSISENQEESSIQSESIPTESIANISRSPKKMIQRCKSVVDDKSNKENDHEVDDEQELPINTVQSPKKQKSKPNTESVQTDKESNIKNVENKKSKKKNKKRKKKQKQHNIETKSDENISEETNKIVENERKKKNKKSKSQNNIVPMDTDQITSGNEIDDDNTSNKQKKLKTQKSKVKVNPNAVTDKESDSEHESDNEIESENEAINKNILKSEQSDQSSDEDEEVKKEQSEQQKEKEVPKEKSEVTGDELKRTLFVGNVPFSAKCKKEIKKIFNKHGEIETIRIRTVPVKDGRYTPKLAVIKNELHPERTTVNVYIKYKEEDSVKKALSENNTILNDHHLRVTRSSHTGVEHDPKCSIFVGNLPFAMEDEALRQKFENCGEIESVRIIRDKKTNAGKGFGYVNFASKDGVELALALTEEDLTIKNRIIRVKRCTQLTNKQKQSDNSVKKQFNRGGNQESRRGIQGATGGFQGARGGFQGARGGFQGTRGGFRGARGGFQGARGGIQGARGGFQGARGGFRESRGGIQGAREGNQSGQRWHQGGPKHGANDEAKDGAHRRIMNKRKNQDNTEEPPNKKQNINEPSKEKKSRKEFVGMTAEKKKKRKFDKGQKKKKALSEILTK